YSALLGKDFPGFLGLLHALVERFLGGLLGFAQLPLAPKDTRQVQVGLAIGRQRGGLAIVLDRLRRLVGEIVGLPERHVGLVVGLEHALVKALLDHRDAVLLVAFVVEVEGVEVAVVALLGELALGAHLLQQRDR